MKHRGRNFVLAFGLALFAVACGQKAPDVADGQGGTLTVGGSATAAGGNRASGGIMLSNGGTPSPTGGQRSSSGTATGGAATGGLASGGTLTGGKSAGGTATGGKSAGGTAAGGNATGGLAAGGAATGGKSSSGTGGASAGGSGSGGVASTGGTKATGGATSTGGANANGGSSGTVDAATMAKAMGFGTNIGNTFDNTTAWETGWGQPVVTQAYINGMASRGIKTVRVPVAWDTYANNGVIDTAKMNRIKEVVSWIEAAGMYSIVNIHWDNGWIFNEGKSTAHTLTDDVKTKFASYWKQIGTAFSGVGHMLVLEGLNEEASFYIGGDTNGTPDIAALNTINQLFVTTVRAQGGFNATRALLIAGFETNSAKTCVNAFTVPTDPAGAGKLFLSFHFYDPYTFTLMEDPASWGSPASTWGTAAEKSALDALFNAIGTCSTNKKIPVIIGEFAVTLGTKVVRQSASRELWMESVAKASKSRGIVPVLWDCGSDISRSDGSLSSALQTVINNIK